MKSPQFKTKKITKLTVILLLAFACNSFADSQLDAATEQRIIREQNRVIQNQQMAIEADLRKREAEIIQRQWAGTKASYEKEDFLISFGDFKLNEKQIKDWCSTINSINDLATEENTNLVKEHDFKKSSEYLKKSAELGNWYAQAELGACYYDGEDRFYQTKFPKDYVEAYKWVFTSMQHSGQRKYDYDMASERLGMIKSKMSDDQVKEAKKASDKWLTENAEFVKSRPLKITPMTKEEIDIEKRKTKELMEKYKPGSRYVD